MQHDAVQQLHTDLAGLIWRLTDEEDLVLPVVLKHRMG